MGNIDIKKVISSIAEKNNPQVFNGLRIKGISVYAAKNDSVRYWATITVDKPIRGTYVDSVVNDVPHYSYGLTTTVTTPIGSLITVLFDALFDINDDTEVEVAPNKKITVEDAATDLVAVKKAMVADFEQLAVDPKCRTAIGSLLVKSSINVISRDVFKEDGKIKSLFSLNEKENEIERDSVWHDIYGISNIRISKIIDAWKKFCVDAPAAPQPTTTTSPLQALLAALGGAGNATVAQDALG